ncbi:hypothetical protein D9542_11670 [Corynebacterium macginleyi]|nr:hypothetical protein D9542_11670 [Corynebacterium macginleyi]
MSCLAQTNEPKREISPKKKNNIQNLLRVLNNAAADAMVSVKPIIPAIAVPTAFTSSVVSREQHAKKSPVIRLRAPGEMAGVTAYQEYASAPEADTDISGLNEKPSTLPTNVQQMPTMAEYASITQKIDEPNSTESVLWERFANT